jgi:hypothetical protein
MESFTLGKLTCYPKDKCVKLCVRCDVCGRTQGVGWLLTTGDLVPTLDSAANFVCSIGWDETEDGWLCPFHSSQGTDKIDAILAKTS